MEFDRLVQHLSPASRELLEQAVACASSRSHDAVDIEHWLQQALDTAAPELNSIFQHFGLATERLRAGAQLALERRRSGNAGFPRISPDIARLLFEAWMLASSQFQTLAIRPGHLLLALIENETLRLRALKLSPELGKLDGEAVRRDCAGLLAGADAGEQAPVEQGGVAKSALDQFTVDMTAQARAGGLDPVLGRDAEIRLLIDILCRRRQNNPILTGEAGVGKTAVVEGLARRIVAGDVPEPLRRVSLRSLDLGLLQAGAGVKGEFENRLKSVIQAVQRSAQPVILFIDEAHTLVGAGSGAGDAANLLKPALARGELRTIAATTWAEYKKYFESDAALTRRFQVVKVDEPDEATAVVMLRGLADELERHHGVTLLDEAVTAAVRLSHRYISGRQLPDKCLSLLDTACARVALSQHTTPPALEACRRALVELDTELARLERERRHGLDHGNAIDALKARQAALEAERSALESRWRETGELLRRIGEQRVRLEREDDSKPADRRALREARAALARLQGEAPLLHECVDAQAVAEVVGDWTGIPVGRMHSDEIHSVLDLERTLRGRVIGQDHALRQIARGMLAARARMSDPRRPLGVFLLVGPSGVGKTETALALAEQLYGSERALTVLNMSEFKEEHKVSLLMGSPPGYVGYGEGGLLTEAVRRRPYSVVLLDEMEKAHPGVQDVFYQVFDKGMLRDGQGRDIDFRNTVIIMTSNTASEQISRLCADRDTRPEADGLIEAVGPALREAYKPAFLGRVSLIPYYPLSEADLSEIAALQFESIRHRMYANYGAEIVFKKTVMEHFVSQCRESDAGARQLHSILSQGLLPTLSERMLKHLAKGEEIHRVNVGIRDGSFSVQIKGEARKATEVGKTRHTTDTA